MNRVVVAAIALFGPAVASPCSCKIQVELDRNSVLDAYCESDVVFVGEVESSIELRQYLSEYKIWPRSSYKGQLLSPTFAIAETGGMCGYEFKPGGKYLVFAWADKKTSYISASVCGYTGLISQREFMIDVLNDLRSSGEDACSSEARAARQEEASRRQTESFQKLLEDSRNVQEKD